MKKDNFEGFNYFFGYLDKQIRYVFNIKYKTLKRILEFRRK